MHVVSESLKCVGKFEILQLIHLVAASVVSAQNFLQKNKTTSVYPNPKLAMLTKAETDNFLEEKLGFRDWKQVLDEDNVEFLRELVKRYGSTLYYENVTWGALNPEDRKSPSTQDIVTQILTTAGGACLHLNYFFKLLLEQLGFHVYPVAGEALAMPLPRNHLVLIVRVPTTSSLKMDKSEEGMDLYLIDVGFGRPITSPIKVNMKDLPHKGKAGGFQFEVRYSPEKRIYERVLHGGCAIKGKFESEDESKVEVIYDFTPLEYHDFDEIHDIIFTDSTRTFFLNTLFLFRFTSIKSPAEFDYVCCRGRTIAFGSADTRQETTFSSYWDMLPVIKEWFPKLNHESLQRALTNYDARSAN